MFHSVSGMGLLVSRNETNGFTPGNKVFHTEKPTVSCRETKSFKGRNKKCPTTEQRFQIPKPGERNAETPLSKD